MHKMVSRPTQKAYVKKPLKKKLTRLLILRRRKEMPENESRSARLVI